MERGKQMTRDSQRRSLAKALVYKGGSITLLAILSYVFTRDLVEMSLITVTYEAIAALGYYLHERIWEHIRWGRHSGNGSNRY